MDQELLRLNVFQDAEVWDAAKYRESLKTSEHIFIYGDWTMQMPTSTRSSAFCIVQETMGVRFHFPKGIQLQCSCHSELNRWMSGFAVLVGCSVVFFT